MRTHISRRAVEVSLCSSASALFSASNRSRPATVRRVCTSMSMALGFHSTTAPLFHHLDDDPDMISFLQDDVHTEVTDALIGFVYDPLHPTGIDDFLNPLPDDDDDARHCAKRARNSCGDDALLDSKGTGGACPGQPWNVGGSQQVPAPMPPEFLTEFALPLPPPQMPPALMRGADAIKGNGYPSVQSAAARERRKRISEKTGELSRLISGGHKLNTAEMLQEAGRHVKLLQAQVGMLALMRSVEQEKIPSMAREQMHALLASGGVQERLAAEDKCLVPTKLIDTVAEDDATRSNALVNRELSRFMDSLLGQ